MMLMTVMTSMYSQAAPGIHMQHAGELTHFSNTLSRSAIGSRSNLAVHLWTSANASYRERLGKLSPRAVFTGKGSFHRIARRLLQQALHQDALCPFARDLVKEAMVAV